MPNIDIFKDIIEAVKKTSTPTTQAYDTPATVTRIEGDVAWVHIPGGVDETPVRLTIAAKAGDTVQLRVGGGTAWLVGNQSAPPTDDTKANEAIRQAKEASGVATDFVTDTKNGIFVHPKNNTADGVRITDSIEIIKGKLSFFRAWIDGELAKVRVGRADAGNTIIDSNGMRVYGGDGTTRLANIGYGEGYNAAGEVVTAPYYELGIRETGAAVGNYSALHGYENESSGMCSVTEGRHSKAVEYCSHAGGYYSEASGPYAFAHGLRTKANFSAMAAFGRYNAPNEQLFMVGNGSSDSDRKNAFQIDRNGNVGIQGSLYSSSSDTLVTKMFLKDGTSTTSASVAAGGTLRVAVNVNRLGYTPMAIAGIQTSSQFTYFTATLSGNEAVVYIKNNGTTAATTPINLIVFYIASSAL